MNNQDQQLPKNHLKLYRDVKNGKLAGVCAGLADYFSIDVNIIRIAVVIAGLTFTFLTLIAYISAAIFLKPKPTNLYEDAEDEAYWRRYRKSPRNTLAEARNRFRRLEHKLRKMESYVTSSKFSLDREFENINK